MADEARRQRLKAALRANLKRRKSRDRDEAASERPQDAATERASDGHDER